MSDNLILGFLLGGVAGWIYGEFISGFRCGRRFMSTLPTPDDEAETDRFLTDVGFAYRESLARKIAIESAHAFELAGEDQDPGDVRDMVYTAAMKVLEIREYNGN